MADVKYPRTPHLPWSEGKTSDDRVILSEDLDRINSMHVVVTEKLDGENTTMTSGRCYARSVDSGSHVSRDWVRALHGSISYRIPKNMRVCGENCFAKHSIYYDNLESYFFVFAVFSNDVCLSWKDTLDWCRFLELIPVPVLYEGPFDYKKIHSSWEGIQNSEGYVVRNRDSFPFDRFCSNVAKYVRKDHVQDNEHWMHSQIVRNKIKGE